MTVANNKRPSMTGQNSVDNCDETREDGSRLSAYEKLTRDLATSEKLKQEVALGKRIGFYRIRGELGSGNFCQVKMGIHALAREKVAIKILDKTKLDQKTQRLLSREISVMERLHHPNIIRIYEVIETLPKLHIVMEYAGGGELFTKISNEGKLPEKTAKKIFSQIQSAVEHMHNKNIIHRDLKAENVFIAGPNLVKVGDFGFSTTTPKDNPLNTFCGSPPYAAPELFRDENYVGIYVDIWALGIMCYFMVTGVMPFRAETVGKLKKCILDGAYYLPDFLSDHCRDLIRNILRPVPSDRFSMEEIRRSKWLEMEVFPEADLKYSLSPPSNEQKCTEDEREALQILNELGISSEVISKGQDRRESITGSYRIILHRVQKKRAELTRKSSTMTTLSHYNNRPRDLRNSRKQEMENDKREQPKSKFCSIL